VRYGGDDGPDLDAVAADLGLRPRDVVDLHIGVEVEVLFLGFAPGFAYLGELSPRLRVPRRATPRVRVPAGSVAVAGSMTAVYPQASPGGWRIIGRTDAKLFDPLADPPARLRPGDRVRFERA
jgi:KipI family sensor histidine kinase inhibitor